MPIFNVMMLSVKWVPVFAHIQCNDVELYYEIFICVCHVHCSCSLPCHHLLPSLFSNRPLLSSFFFLKKNLDSAREKTDSCVCLNLAILCNVIFSSITHVWDPFFSPQILNSTKFSYLLTSFCNFSCGACIG